MEDWEKLFDNAELSHIGEQIVNYLGVDDLWSLRQVNKKLKNIAEEKLLELFNRIEEHWQNFPTLSWHGNTAFWKRRGACNFIKFHQFFEIHRNEFRSILDIVIDMSHLGKIPIFML